MNSCIFHLSEAKRDKKKLTCSFTFLLLLFVKVRVIEQAKKTWQKEVDKYILNNSRLIN